MANGQHASDSAAGDAGSQPSASIFLSYLGILRRRFWIILPIVLIATTAGVIKAFRTPRLYRALTRMLVEKQSPSVFEGNAAEAAAWDPDFYSTQKELVRSRSVLETALRSEPLREVLESGKRDVAETTSVLAELKRTVIAALGVTPPPPPELWDRLRGMVVVTHILNTHFIEIEVVDPDGARAAVIANEVARGFQVYHHDRQLAQLGEAFEMLRHEKEREERELLEAERQLQEFRETAQTVSVPTAEADQPVIDRLNKLNEELTSVQLERIDLSSQLSVMRETFASDSLADEAVNKRLFAIPVVQTDSELGQARQRLAVAEKELAILRDTYGAQHPLLRAAQTNVSLLRDQFREGLAELIASHENRLAMLRAEEAELEQSYEVQKRQALELAKETFEFTRLQNSLDRHRTLFDSLVQRMREVDVNQNTVKTNVQIVEEATNPTVPINSSKPKIILFACCLGLFLGGGLAFLFENLDDTIKTPEDLTERLDVPLLGFVPFMQQDGADETEPQKRTFRASMAQAYRDMILTVRNRLPAGLKQAEMDADAGPQAMDEERRQRGTMVVAQPMSSIAEAYRSIRANLFYARPAEEIKLLAVTSCRPREGKTTTATNLALSVAQTGKRVLLIDGDLHRPTVHKALGLRTDTGLTSVLVGECDWRQALRKVVHEGRPIEQLDVLVSGPSTPSPSELLGSNRMRELLAEFREHYDWVLIDTPPVLFVSDASILSVLCDGVILIVKSGDSTRSLLTRAVERLAGVRAHILGSILNSVQVSRVGRYYSTYYHVGYSRYASDYRRTYYAKDGEAEARDAGPEAAPAAGEAISDYKAAYEQLLASSRATEGALKTSLDKAKEAGQAAKVAAAEREKELAALREQADALQTGDSQRLVETLKAALDKERRRCAELEAAAVARPDTGGPSAAVLNAEIESLKQDLVAARHLAARSQERHGEAATALNATIDALRNDMGQRDRQIQELRRQIAEATTAATDAGESDRLRGELRQRDERIQALRAELEEQGGAVAELRQEVELQQAAAKRRRGTDQEASTQRALKAEQALAKVEADAAAQLAAFKQREEALQAEVAAGKRQPPPPPAEPERPRRKDVRTAMQQANLHLSAGQYGEARDILGDVVASKPETTEAWEGYIESLAALGDQSRLSTCAKTLADGRSGQRHLYSLAWGYLAFLQQDLVSAERYFGEAQSAAPRRAAPLEALTRLAVKRQDMAAASVYAQRLLKFDPRNAYGHHVAVFQHILDGEPTRAEETLRRSLEARRTPEALGDLAWLLRERGALDEAEQTVREGIKLNEQQRTLWETLGAILLDRKQDDDAAEAFGRVLALDRSCLAAQLHLAEIATRQGKTERAKELVTALVRSVDQLSKDDKTRLAAVRQQLSANG